MKKNLLKGLIFMFAVICLLAGSAWADTAAAKDDGAEQLEEQKETYFAHRSYVTLHFQDNEMDFSFGWLLGSIGNGGAEIGEAFYAAGQIKDGDPKSWEEQWQKMGERVEKEGDESFKAGHKISAGMSYLRAANYYRTVLMTLNPTKPEFLQIGKKARALFKKGVKMSTVHTEYVEIPFEGTVLPGYFSKPDKSMKKRKTIIMVGGGETFAEGLYFYIAPQAVKRGYNYIGIDIPGQGLMPAEGKPFRYDAEVPLKAILDYTLKRPDVDPENVFMYGISGGGYFVPRIAAVDNRISGIAVNSAVVDDYKLFASMPFASETEEEIKNWEPFKLASTSVIAWRWGLDPSNIKGLVEANKGYVVDPSKIECPALVLIGEGEYANEEIQRQQKEFLAALKNPKKKFVITKIDQGASSHCISENRAYMSQLVFDFFDELVK